MCYGPALDPLKFELTDKYGTCIGGIKKTFELGSLNFLCPSIEVEIFTALTSPSF